MDPSFAVAISLALEVIEKAWQAIASSRDSRENDRRKAQLAVWKAFDSTTAYYRHLERGGLPNEKEEAKLAGIWRKASLSVEPYCPSVAAKMMIKGNFWSDGGRWNDEQIKQAGIQLEMIRTAGIVSLDKSRKNR